jgi:hypothetical protein
MLIEPLRKITMREQQRERERERERERVRWKKAPDFLFPGNTLKTTKTAACAFAKVTNASYTEFK